MKYTLTTLLSGHDGKTPTVSSSERSAELDSFTPTISQANLPMSLSAYSMSIELIIWTNNEKLEYKKSQTGLKPPYLWQPHSSIPYKSNIRNHIAKRQNTSLSLILQLHPHFIRRILAIREVAIPKINPIMVHFYFPIRSRT